MKIRDLLAEHLLDDPWIYGIGLESVDDGYGVVVLCADDNIALIQIETDVPIRIEGGHSQPMAQ